MNVLGISCELEGDVDDEVEVINVCVRGVVSDDVVAEGEDEVAVKVLVEGETVELCEVELVDVDVLVCWFDRAK